MKLSTRPSVIALAGPQLPGATTAAARKMDTQSWEIEVFGKTPKEQTQKYESQGEAAKVTVMGAGGSR
jgi:hypothetical protein